MEKQTLKHSKIKKYKLDRKQSEIGVKQGDFWKKGEKSWVFDQTLKDTQNTQNTQKKVMWNIYHMS